MGTHCRHSRPGPIAGGADAMSGIPLPREMLSPPASARVDLPADGQHAKTAFTSTCLLETCLAAQRGAIERGRMGHADHVRCGLRPAAGSRQPATADAEHCGKNGAGAGAFSRAQLSPMLPQAQVHEVMLPACLDPLSRTSCVEGKGLRRQSRRMLSANVTFSHFLGKKGQRELSEIARSC